MAGPSYIHYRTADNIVTGVFTTSITPHSGEVEVFETHPLFVPPVTLLVWERTGVSTYILNDPAAEPVVVQVLEDLTDVIFDSGLAAGDVLTFDGLNWVNQTPLDELVKVSEYDTMADYLGQKIVGGTDISVDVLTDSAGVETVQISFMGAAAPGTIKVSSDDAGQDYLENTLFGTTNHITVTTVTDSLGDETVILDIGTDVFDKTVDDTDDITEGVVNLFYTDERVDDRVAALLVGGTSITITYDDSAGSLTIDNDFPEQVRVSATDTVPSYLEDALTAGSFITLTTLTDSFGDETVEISFNGVATDELVKVSSNDALAEYLEDKVLGGSFITVTTLTDSAGVETLNVAFDGIVLEDVLDVTYDSAAPQTGDLLQYNGSYWNNIPPEDIPEVNTWSFNGGYINIGASETKGASWGESTSEAGITMVRDSEITGISASMTLPRTAGSVTFMLVLNGVAQNDAGYTIDIDASNTYNNYLEFTTPFLVSAGDLISMQGVSTTFAPVVSDVTLSFWGRYA